MSNSSLVNYKRISSHKNSPRTQKISKITIHHMAGYMSAKQCVDYFADTDRKVSSNYTIGSDGQVGMSVEEKDRAWTSSSAWNDNRAITIEVANDGGKPDWHVSDKALAKLIELCIDICKRNGIKELKYTGDKNGSLTLHKMFANTGCPGPYLESKIPYIVKSVNSALSAPKTDEKAKSNTTSTPATETSKTSASGRKKGDAVKLNKANLYVSATATKVAGHITGTYYLYDGKAVNGRYRVTINKKCCGKQPTAYYVTGWVKL